jgi:hypothetical protein
LILKLLAFVLPPGGPFAVAAALGIAGNYVTSANLVDLW